MNICLLSRTLSLSRGGIGRVSLKLQQGLVKRGNTVKLVVGGDTSLYSYFVHTAVVAPLRLLGKECDVYHAVTPLEAVWVPKSKGVVTFLDVFSVTDTDKCGAGLNYTWKKKFAGKYFSLASKVALNCRGVACISEETKSGVVRLFGASKEKVRVIRLGINEDLSPRKRETSEFTIGYLGQLDARKRVGLLIDSFIKTGCRGRLLIAGRGFQEEFLRKIAGSSNKVVFLGELKDRELLEFYNSLDVFVFPTWVEGYGLPIVEAMACRKPVVVLSDSIIPRELKDRCVVVSCLDDFLLEPKRYINGTDLESNLEFAKLHSWDKCIDEYLSLYKEVLSER